MGCISPNLDSIADAPDRRDLIVQLGTNALQRLRARGDMLDRAYLNSLGVGGKGSYFTGDVETKLFAVVGEKFIELLEGKLLSDASHSPLIG